MTAARVKKKLNKVGLVLLTTILLAQFLVLPAAWGQSQIPNVDGLEFDDELLNEPWSDPIERFGLADEPLAPIPDFDFDELSSSDVIAEGVGSQSVDSSVDVSAESERHLLALQAVATAELARQTVDDNIASARSSIAAATQGIGVARELIATAEDDIAAAEDEVSELDAADSDEAQEQARLDDEITNRQLAILEVAMQSFTGEDLELETLLLNPDSTEVLERRIVVDQVREIHVAEIDAFQVLFDQSQGRRDQLAAERAPVAAAIVEWESDIVSFNGDIADHIEDRVQLRADISDETVRGEEVDVIIEDTLAFAEATAAQYQVAYHQVLDGFVSNTDLPLVALNAYVRASRTMASEQSSCGIHWSQLAGIGRIESFHGYFGSSTLDVNGNTTTDILGLPLDGRVLGGVVTDDLPDATGRTEETAGVQRLALILDSDDGALDGDRVYDRAVGPMQFIPTTWAIYGADGNNDGVEDPQNIYDASLAAARYLCAAPGSMLTSSGEQRAYFAYNHDLTYSLNVTNAGRSYHNRLDVSPESSSFASFARYAVPEAAPVTAAPAAAPVAEVLGTTEEADEVVPDETVTEAPVEEAAIEESPQAEEAAVEEVTAEEPFVVEAAVAEPAVEPEPAVEEE